MVIKHPIIVDIIFIGRKNGIFSVIDNPFFYFFRVCNILRIANQEKECVSKQYVYQWFIHKYRLVWEINSISNIIKRMGNK